jgi:hypothetical protein
MSYRARMGDVFEALAEGLAPYVDRRMAAHLHGERDWILTAASKLGKRPDVVVSVSDPQFQLEVISRFWGPVFSDDLAGSSRPLVTDLLGARNNWAHINDEHPLGFDDVKHAHSMVAELLADTGHPCVERMEDLDRDVRHESVQVLAEENGLDEHAALLARLAELQGEREDLQGQLASARATANSQSGRTRAVARQLADLQTQYAAVAGLSDKYEALQGELSSVRHEDDTQREADLRSARDAMAMLQEESSTLHRLLAQARADVEDPIGTEVGQRWMWLVASLLVALSMVMAMVTL